MTNERISALMDGEADEPELTRDLVHLSSNGDLRRTWDTYHLIGDTLRGHAAPALAAKVSQRLAGEPTVLAPPRRAPRGKIAQLVYSAAAGVAALVQGEVEAFHRDRALRRSYAGVVLFG